MRNLWKPMILAISMLFLALTAACGAEQGVGSGTGASSPTAPAPAADVKTIEHALGKTEIKGTPQRIVALEWTYAEDLLALGVPPVGIADIKGYHTWMNVQAPLPADVQDVGNRQEPSLEAIAALKPDLLITSELRAKTNYDELSRIAPTIVFNPYPPEGAGMTQYDEMESAFRTIADIVGKQDEAKKVLADLNQAYEQAKAKLAAKGKAGAAVAVTQAYSQQNAAVMRMFTDNSMTAQIMGRMGLKNAYRSNAFQLNGFETTGVESLPQVQEAHFIYIVQDNDNVFETLLKDNAVWKGLAFVKENRTYRLPGNTWPFGGPLSAKVLVELTTDALTK